MNIGRPIALALLGAVAGAAAQDQADAGADDQALLNKLQPYIECINRHSERASDSYDRYRSWMKNPEKGPTGRERIVYGLYTLYDPADCVAGITAAATAGPRQQSLEAAGAAYASALDAVKRLTEEANEYYELEDYRDDRMQRGKEMHPALMSAYQDFVAADDRLRAAVANINDALQLRMLARIEAEQGRNLNYQIKHLTIRARHLVSASSVASLKQIDPGSFVPRLEAYEAAYRDLRSYAREHPEATDGVILYNLAESAAMDYLKSAKQLGRYLRDGRRWDSGERMLIEAGSAWMVEGHPARVVRDYNTLIERINSLR